MPLYEFYCAKCEREIAMTLTIREKEQGEYKCPGCGCEAKDLRPKQPGVLEYLKALNRST